MNWDEWVVFACLADDTDWHAHESRLRALPASDVELVVERLFSGLLVGTSGAKANEIERAIQRVSDILIDLLALSPRIQFVGRNARQGKNRVTRRR